MSRAPFVMAKGQTAFDRRFEMHDTTIGWRFTNPKLSKLYHPFSMGETAENVAKKWNISREDQDAFAWNSQQKWKSAKDAGKWEDEIISVAVPQRKGDPIIIDTDEHPRPEVALEKLATLRPAFSKRRRAQRLRPENSSGVNDGAAAMVSCRRISCEVHLDYTSWGTLVHARQVASIQQLWGRDRYTQLKNFSNASGLSTQDIDLFELNEAFAAQSLACIREMGIDPAIVNVNGGAIAMGHPLGCSGARIAVTLLHELNRQNKKRGVATLCVGVGQGLATLFEGEAK